MHHALAPIPCKPWSLSGLSERLIVSHYENDYGAAVRSLNATRADLDALVLGDVPAYQLLAMKREEIAATNSVILHELYFGSLGGDGGVLFTGSGHGNQILEPISTALRQAFGSVVKWRQEFAALAEALSHGSGWVVLNYSRRDGRLYNHIAVDHSHAMIDAVPLLALDMYEHAYHMDYGAAAARYVDAVMANLDWARIYARYKAAVEAASEPFVASQDDVASAVILDVRRAGVFDKASTVIPGSQWRDPAHVAEWAQEQESTGPVVVYCVYGHEVGRATALRLRAAGVDARFLHGGIDGWERAGRPLGPKS